MSSVVGDKLRAGAQDAVVENTARDDILVSGHVIRMIRDEWNVSQAEFAKLVGVSREWVVLTEKLDNRRIRKRTMNLIAERMGLNPQDAIHLLSKLSRYSFDRKEREGVHIPGPVAHTPAGRGLDQNVSPVSDSTMYDEIPTFALAIHASQWAVVEDNVQSGERVTDSQFRRGIFRVRVHGDCMEPKYPDGCTVEFKLLRNREGEPDLVAMSPGKNYYVQVGAESTFKTFVRAEGGDLVLRPLNKRYRATLRAPMCDVTQLAVAVGKFEPEP